MLVKQKACLNCIVDEGQTWVYLTSIYIRIVLQWLSKYFLNVKGTMKMKLTSKQIKILKENKSCIYVTSRLSKSSAFTQMIDYGIYHLVNKDDLQYGHYNATTLGNQIRDAFLQLDYFLNQVGSEA